jgi:hypothetical protein
MQWGKWVLNKWKGKGVYSKKKEGRLFLKKGKERRAKSKEQKAKSKEQRAKGKGQRAKKTRKVFFQKKYNSIKFKKNQRQLCLKNICEKQKKRKVFFDACREKAKR